MTNYIKTCGIITLLVISSSLHADDESLTLLEAEDKNTNNASIQILQDPAASGLNYVTSANDYNPLFIGDLPAIEAPRLTVWARVRGHAIQLKGVAPDAKQIELKWNWSKPATWQWVSLGTYERAQLGLSIFIIRGAGATPGAGLDAVIISTDPTFRPQDSQSPAIN